MKNFRSLFPSLLLSSWILLSICDVQKKPNIVIIMADDLGWNDVSFHGSSEIPTPNIDALAYNGVILNRFYTPPLCTPSRSSFMTGKYPTKLGMNHFVIPSDEPWGLPLNEKVISEYFKEAGYRTSLVGKWHLGFYQKAYTPTLRGFDSHFGYLGPYIGYYDYSLQMHDRNYSRGYDMRRNLSTNYDINPKPYVTELFTDEAVNVIRHHNKVDPLFLVVNHLAPHAGNEEPDNPLEAPEEEIKKFAHIKSKDRRTLAAMISVMDQGIGRIITAIENKGIMNNTIILFFSDNGGPTRGQHSTEASNYPLRGQKGSPWEGGCRVVACIYSPLLKSVNRVSNEFMYVTDWLPTLAAAANITIKDKSIDGINQWDTISLGTKSKRKEILYNIENVVGYSALMHQGWKLVNGTENINNANWFGSSGADSNISFKSYANNILESEASRSLPKIKLETIGKMRDEATVKCNVKNNEVKCDPRSAPCLFNILEDPCEQNNLVDVNTDQLEILLSKLSVHVKNMIPIRRRPIDAKCDPIHFNGTWTWWQESEVERFEENAMQNIVIYFACVLFSILVLYFCCLRYNSRKRSRAMKMYN